MELSRRRCSEMYGRGVTPGNLILYLGISAMVAAVIKILFSKRGRVSLAGINLQWGN